MKSIRRNILLMAFMFAASGSAIAFLPKKKIDDERSRINLETMIPKQFGNWTEMKTLDHIVESPEVQAQLNKIYNQTLSRTYTDNKGDKIMLAIAYGGEQSASLQVHRPEVCYAAQGFVINKKSKNFIDVNGKELPVMQLVAIQGQRVEPIMYWIMIGDSAVRGNLEQGLTRLKYGLTGEIPSGMLIRVSTISSDEVQSYRIEGQFVRDMLAVLPVQYRKILTGTI